ncbi:hypothetical protein JCM8547_000614 [Rhodosporidiobolus lusitaniae]
MCFADDRDDLKCRNKYSKGAACPKDGEEERNRVHWHRCGSLLDPTVPTARRKEGADALSAARAPTGCCGSGAATWAGSIRNLVLLHSARSPLPLHLRKVHQLHRRTKMLSKAEIREQLNLATLKKHDASITAIVSSTSYASVYENRGEGWVKTGVEGPMFLFSRTTFPSYGFFVLNRQGLEYVQEFLTEESEVRVEGEFILFEGGGDVDRATGIWVFEEKERVEVCQQMEALRQKAVAKAKPALATPSLPIGQSISLDMLFSAASPASSPAVAAAVAPNPPRAPLANPLDALFASAAASAPSPVQSYRTAPAPQPAPASPAPAPAYTGGFPTTLEQLFAAASPVPQAARLPAQQQQVTPASPAQQPAAKPPTGMALLDSIFASAKQSPVPQAARLPTSASSPYQTPVPQPATLPSHASPLPGTGSQTLPPVSPSQQPDARAALMSMIGLSSAAPSPVVSTVTTPAAQPLQANPFVNGDLAPSSSLVAAPHTTEHPAPFSLDRASAAKQPKPKQQSPKQEKTSTLSASKPFFAPPVLSHDIFDQLPLPGSKGKSKGKEVVPPAAPPTAKPAPALPSPPAPPAPQPEPVFSPPPPPAATPPALPSPSAAGVASPTPPSGEIPLLSKAELLGAIDSGLASAPNGGEQDGTEGPMEKDEFVKRVVEMVQKPSFAMQLYGRYLERWEELQYGGKGGRR